MHFNKHSNLEGQHAFLSPSQCSWLRYDENRLVERFKNWKAAERGTQLHDFAARAIGLGIRLQNVKKTINMFVNDSILYGMTPEQVLYYSENCFGTADAISFKHEKKYKKGILRIHDLKTGTTEAKMDQLMIYAALFCLEYDYIPSSIGIILAIYQYDQRIEYIPDHSEITTIMKTIEMFDDIISDIQVRD